jgi:hypothetical protein
MFLLGSTLMASQGEGRKARAENEDVDGALCPEEPLPLEQS